MWAVPANLIWRFRGVDVFPMRFYIHLIPPVRNSTGKQKWSPENSSIKDIGKRPNALSSFAELMDRCTRRITRQENSSAAAKLAVNGRAGRDGVQSAAQLVVHLTCQAGHFRMTGHGKHAFRIHCAHENLRILLVHNGIAG